MTYLLDVNVLIALIDQEHVAHDIAHDWFAQTGRAEWATCPITENGVIRILGHPRYPGSPGTPAAIASILQEMCRLPGHVFWSDSISLLAQQEVATDEILTHAQVTDTYLLALARANVGRLATLDRRLSIRAVKGGRSALHIIGSGLVQTPHV